MSALTLQWYDAGREKTQTIYEQQQQTKNPGTVRIGRDPLRCDIVLSDPTVSGLHVEIFFNLGQFLIRNLRSSNPPLVNGKQLTQGEQALQQGSVIFLGQAQLKVIAIFSSDPSNVPPTVLSGPPINIPVKAPTKPLGNQQQATYGLECPRCHKVSSTDYLHIGCRWCGTSLAAAASVLVEPKNQ
ncbi:FHA domain containing protein [Calothrix sp. NIES-4071]|nr:FHA domain containing protein [Calothrix sp. NIES-4071]BAZ62807.1 FHA domain containing protein [Calothrix sp. NIES-4105]